MRIETSVTIHRPIALVFAYAAAYAHDPQWRGHILDVTLPAGVAIGVGVRFERVTQLLGTAVCETVEVIEYAPERACGLKSITAMYPTTELRLFQGIAGSTRFTMRIEMEGPPTDATIERTIQRHLRADGLYLRDQLEGLKGKAVDRLPGK